MVVFDSFADDADAGCVLVGGDEEVVDESVIVEDEEVEGLRVGGGTSLRVAGLWR